MDNPTFSESSQICQAVPTRMQDCHKLMDKTPNEFKGQALCLALRGSTGRLFDVQFTTVEKKFKTKLTKVTLSMPRDAWMELKAYRVRLWKAGKNWAATEKDPDDDKKKEE